MGCHSLNHARQKVMNKMKFKVIVKGKCAVCGKEIQDDGFFLCKVCRLLNKDHEQAEGGAVESSPMIGGENMETVADIIEEVKEKICDEYCKYSGDEDAEKEKCPDCPLGRLG